MMDLEDLVARIQSLEQELAQLRALTSDADSPLQRVFIASVASDLKWQEKARFGTSWVDFGRLCDDAKHASAAVDLDSDQFALLEVDDQGDKRYIRLGGGVRVRDCDSKSTPAVARTLALATGLSLTDNGSSEYEVDVDLTAETEDGTDLTCIHFEPAASGCGMVLKFPNDLYTAGTAITEAHITWNATDHRIELWTTTRTVTCGMIIDGGEESTLNSYVTFEECAA